MTGDKIKNAQRFQETINFWQLEQMSVKYGKIDWL